MKYLPIEQGLSSQWDVDTTVPVRVTYNRNCRHPGEPVKYQMMDRRSRHMDKYYGTCCGACGRILEKVRNR